MFPKVICIEILFEELEVVGNVQLQSQGFAGATDKKEYEIVVQTFKHRVRSKILHAVAVDHLSNYTSPMGLVGVHNKLAGKRYKLPDRKFEDRGEVNLLIGTDYYYDIVHSGQVNEDGLIPIPTIYGYILSGQLQSSESGADVKVVTIRLRPNKR